MSTTTAASSRPWSPDGTDHLIFKWVRLEGKSQSWAARQFGIDQSTVSRMIQRYERWQAHAADRADGRLDHAERLRYQLWLTFERNEQILASCLRIANEIEGFTDTSKSTIRRPFQSPSQESVVSTEHSVLDRTGTVSRFLRLAFRVNMEQFKLAQLDPAPLPTSLSEEELADLVRSAAEAAAELAAAKRRAREEAEDILDRHSQPGDLVDDQDTTADLVTSVPAGNAPPRGSSLADAPISDDPAPTLNFEPGTLNSPSATPAPTHNLHNPNPTEIAATHDQPCSCEPQSVPTKKPKQGRITENGSRHAEAPAIREGEAPAEPSNPITPQDRKASSHNGKRKTIPSRRRALAGAK